MKKFEGYTKGPWSVGASMISTWTRAKQDAGERIQEIALVRENLGLGPTTRQEYEANRDLIGAAPEMAELLDDCRTEINCMFNLGPDVDVLAELLERINALLGPAITSPVKE